MAGPADAAHLDHVGDDDPQAVGTDDPSAALGGELDHLRHIAAGDPLGDDHDELHAVLERLEHGVLGKGGGYRHDRAVDRRAVMLDGLCDRVEHGDAVDIAPQPSWRDAADDPCALAVVEALTREVHGLAAGDPLDDERRVLVDEDAHAAPRPPAARSPSGLAGSGGGDVVRLP